MPATASGKSANAVAAQTAPSDAQTEAPAAAPRSAPHAPLFITCGLILTVLAIYGQTLGFEFVAYDDDVDVSHNPYVSRGLSLEGLRWAFRADLFEDSPHANYWMPLNHLSHMLVVQLAGMYAGAHHLVNAALHAANAALLFRLLLLLIGRLWPAALIAALFAAHPLHVESVAWVTERKDVLSGLFWLLGMLAYARYCRRRTLARYLPVLLCFALGLLVKASLVVFPFALLLLDFYPLRRLELRGPNPWRQALRQGGPLIAEKIPLFLLGGLVALITYSAHQRIGSTISLEAFPPGARLANLAVSYCMYLYKFLLPTRLCAFYPYFAGGAGFKINALCALILAAVTLLALWQAAARPWLAAGWFWFCGILIPVSGIAQAGDQAWADRFFYLPAIGVYSIAALALAELVARKPAWRVPLLALVIGALVAYAALAFEQTRTWRDNFALAGQMLKCNPRNYKAFRIRGLEFMRRREWRAGIAEFENSLAIQPMYEPRIYYNLGLGYQQLKQPQPALAHFNRALEIDPRYAEAWCDRGILLLEQDELERALADLRRAVELAPDALKAQLNLGDAWMRKQDYAAALKCFEAAAALDPQNPDAWNGLGITNAELGRLERAEQCLRRALELNPRDEMIQYNLDYLLQRRRTQSRGANDE